jgi:hypothetical protein
MKKGAYTLNCLVPKDEIGRELRPAKIQIPIFEPKIFRYVNSVFKEEGRSFGIIEQLPFLDHYLNFSGGQVGVMHAFGARPDQPLDCKDVFGAQNMCFCMGLWVGLRRKDNLGQSMPVPEIDED